MRAILALEDGRFFIGESFGASGSGVGEACFNTSMTGYQEVLTDPSYRGQIVAMTTPQIGNYGVNGLDAESATPHVRGFVIEELSPIASNWRATGTLDDYLKANGNPRRPGHRYAGADEASAVARGDAGVLDQRRYFTGGSGRARPAGAGHGGVGFRPGGHAGSGLRLGSRRYAIASVDDREGMARPAPIRRSGMKSFPNCRQSGTALWPTTLA